MIHFFGETNITNIFQSKFRRWHLKILRPCCRIDGMVRSGDQPSVACYVMQHACEATSVSLSSSLCTISSCSISRSQIEVWIGVNEIRRRLEVGEPVDMIMPCILVVCHACIFSHVSSMPACRSPCFVTEFMTQLCNYHHRLSPESVVKKFR